MRQDPARIDICFLYSATSMAKQYIERYNEITKKLNEDTDREKRLAKHECKACYYIYGKIGGCAITWRNCGICGKEECYGNTCTSVI